MASFTCTIGFQLRLPLEQTGLGLFAARGLSARHARCVIELLPQISVQACSVEFRVHACSESSAVLVLIFDGGNNE